MHGPSRETKEPAVRKAQHRQLSGRKQEHSGLEEGQEQCILASVARHVDEKALTVYRKARVEQPDGRGRPGFRTDFGLSLADPYLALLQLPILAPAPFVATHCYVASWVRGTRPPMVEVVLSR